ncbi:MmgE/PrpD family protein [Amycolatopsis sp. K13G38]|uniref:MmgE/PrpD family protein n=1 Tax=Amycolatopsis acididurans TaxID=2724524 RepID=A0ABX1IYF4_9PSEU|nr:MmgE/PrpD family protein [Amycolatopsis acididurans]NKQ51774.1 MmgE/PrpD family protein [Amycolatopsis acididurans]
MGEPGRDWVAALSMAGEADLSDRERTALAVLIADALGIAGAGRTAPGVADALSCWENDLGTGAVRLPWTRASLPAPAAAAALAALIHAWDFDDTHDSAVVHTSCVALPSALAVALAHGRSGADAAAGVVAGVQVLARVAAAIGGQRGMIRTAALGALGAAAAAARTLGLDEERFTSALGLALPATGSAMTRQVVAEGSPAKRLQPSLAVQAGVSAALLANRGVRGPMSWLDGDYGILALREDGDSAAAFAGIRAPGWEIAQLSLKPYPACRYTHAAIDAVLGARAEGLDTAVVHVPAGQAYALVARPFQWRGQPVADVQFSIPWLVAAALREGRVDLSSLREPVLTDPEIERLAARIHVEQDLPAQVGMAPAEVDLRYVDGTTMRRHAEMPGSPAHPLTIEQVEAKIAACVPDPAAVSKLATGLAGLGAGELRAALSTIDTQES